MVEDGVKPQHDLDAQRQGRAWITDRGREVVAYEEHLQSLRPYLDNLINTAFRMEELLGR